MLVSISIIACAYNKFGQHHSNVLVKVAVSVFFWRKLFANHPLY